MTGCRVEVCPDPFDPWQQLALWSGDAAAAAIFIGRVRPTTMDGRPLEVLELEHFPGPVSYTHLTLPTILLV